MLGLICAAYSDDKYRTYAKFTGSGIPANMGGCPSNPGIDQIKHRPANQYFTDADYISVGTIDGNPHSPLSEFEDVSDIALRFSMLVEKTSEIPGGPDWLSAYAMYAGAVDPSIPANKQSKEQILNLLMTAECGTVTSEGRCQNYITMADLFFQQHSQETEVVFEIGNEPNIFPYMSGKLYAWFYWKVRKNLEKANEAFPGKTFKFMPAGLWIVEGLPDDVRNRILNSDQHNRVSYIVTGRDANTSGGLHFPHQSTLDYYNEFLNELTSLNIQENPGSPLTGADFVDKGNLHFYPYTYTYGTFSGLQGHIDNLRQLTDHFAANSVDHDVWITEFGNLNPLNEHATGQFLTAMNAGLEQVSSQTYQGPNWQGLSRWYYFIADGDDSKFDALPYLAPEFAVNKSTLLSQRCVEPTSLDPDGWLGRLICLLRDFKNQPAIQGMVDPVNHRLRSVGRIYIEKATGAPCSPLTQHAPYMPSDPHPANGEVIGNNGNQNQMVSLNWLGGDPDGEAVVSQVQTLLSSGAWQTLTTTQDNFLNFPFPPNIRVDWRIVSTDGLDIVTGPTWSFFTTASTPIGPNVPAPLFPADGQVISPDGSTLIAPVTSTHPQGKTMTYTAKAIDLTTGTQVGIAPLNPTTPTFVIQVQNNKHYSWQVTITDSDNLTLVGPVWEFFTIPTNRVLLLNKDRVLKASYATIPEAVIVAGNNERIRVLSGTHNISQSAEINSPTLPGGGVNPSYTPGGGPQNVIMTFDAGATVNFNPPAGEQAGIYLNQTGRILVGEGVQLNPSIQLVDAHKRAEASDPIRGIFSSIKRSVEVSQPRQTTSLTTGLYVLDGIRFVDESLIGKLGNSRANSTIIQFGDPTIPPVDFSNSEGILFKNLQFEINLPNHAKNDPYLQFRNGDPNDFANSEYKNCVFVNTSNVPKNGNMFFVRYINGAPPTGGLRFTNCLFKNFNKAIDIELPTDAANAPILDGNIFDGNEVGIACPQGGSCFGRTSNNDFWKNGCDLTLGAACHSGQAQVSSVATASNKFLDPMFIDEKNLNFRLISTASPGSPLIDAHENGYSDIGPFQLSTSFELSDFVDGTITSGNQVFQVVNGEVAQNTAGASVRLEKRIAPSLRAVYDVIFEKNLSASTFQSTISQRAYSTPPALSSSHPVVRVFFNQYESKQVPFDFLPDDGTSYSFPFAPDNVHPDRLNNFQVISAQGGNSLSWTPLQQSDVERYKIFRSSSQANLMDAANQIATLDKTAASYTDAGQSAAFFYAMVAYDFSGNQGDAAVTTTVLTWVPNHAYQAGDMAAYNGIVYEARQSHTSQIGWEPPNVLALWQRPTPEGVTAWASQTNYVVGSQVTYQGNSFECLQAHVSQVGWEPTNAPALWESGSAPPSGLPSPWSTQDIGNPGVVGSAAHSSGTFTVNGSGSDIWGNADGFRFVYQPLSGDVEIKARVASIQNTHSWAKAGVMIRESLSSGSPHGSMLVTPGSGLAFQRRTTMGGTSSSTGASGFAPKWVRLTRIGGTITAYSSDNGTTWTQVSSQSITLASTVYVGLAVTSHNNSVLCQAVFDNVSVGVPNPWTKTDVGAVGLAGSTTVTGTSGNLDGSGADIWGNADAYTFVHRSLNGDGSITARVTSVENTHAWAKAGVMIRESLAAGSKHAHMLVSAASGLSFQRRTSTDGTSSSTTVSGAAPYWIRLERSGSTLTGYQSSDGVNWTQVGSTTISMGTNIYMGLAVTSHNNTTLCTATFDNISVVE